MERMCNIIVSTHMISKNCQLSQINQMYCPPNNMFSLAINKTEACIITIIVPVVTVSKR